MTQAMSSAMKGPSWPIGGSLLFKVSTVVLGWGGECSGAGARFTRRQPPLKPSAAPGAYFLPQHSSMPVLVSLLSTPATGLSAISVTPVSV